MRGGRGNINKREMASMETERAMESFA